MGRLRTLPDALADAARGDAGYLFAAGRADTFRSFADIRIASMRAARALREAGLRRGDLVALVIADAEAFLTMLCAASMAGVIPASLYPPALMGAGDLSRYFQLTAGILRAARATGGRDERGARAGVRRPAPALPVVVAGDRARAVRCAARRAGRSAGARRHRVRPVHLGVDLGAERRGAHARQPVGQHRRHQRTRGPDDRGRRRRRQLAAAQSRHGAGRHGARRDVRRPSLRAAAAADVREAAGRVAAGADAPSAAPSALRRRLPTTCACAASRTPTSRASTCRAGAWPGAAPSRSIRRRSRRSRASSPPPGSAKPASFRATASRSTCWPRRSRRAGTPAPHRETSLVSCGTPLPRPFNPHRGRGQTAGARAPGRRDSAGGPVGHAGLLSTRTSSRRDDRGRLAAHRRSGLSGRRRVVRLRPGEGRHHCATAGSTIRRISSGPSTISPACGAAAWSRSAPPEPGARTAS